MISSKGINNGIQHLKPKDFERYKAIFDKIRERKNGETDYPTA